MRMSSSVDSSTLNNFNILNQERSHKNPFCLTSCGTDSLTVAIDSDCCPKNTTAEALLVYALSKLEPAAGSTIYVDLKNYPKISDTLLQKLINLEKKVSAVGGRLLLHDPSPEVIQDLARMRLDKFLTVAKSLSSDQVQKTDPSQLNRNQKMADDLFSSYSRSQTTQTQSFPSFSSNSNLRSELMDTINIFQSGDTSVVCLKIGKFNGSLGELTFSEQVKRLNPEIMIADLTGVSFITGSGWIEILKTVNDLKKQGKILHLVVDLANPEKKTIADKIRCMKFDSKVPGLAVHGDMATAIQALTV